MGQSWGRFGVDFGIDISRRAGGRRGEAAADTSEDKRVSHRSCYGCPGMKEHLPGRRVHPARLQERFVYAVK